MNILGIGIISTHGRGTRDLDEALLRGPSEPLFVEIPSREDPFPVYSVSADTLKDRQALGGARRADRFSKMALLAAWDAAHSDSVDCTACDPTRTGLVLASAFGPHVTTFAFLDDILDFGDASVSPTRFSNSVHNIAAGYISIALDLRGPSLTLTDFNDPFRTALQTAQVWLEQGICDDVLVGCVDECGEVMEYICSQKIPIVGSASEMRAFFDPRGPAVIPGEGAVFFRLSRSTPSSLSMKLAADGHVDADMLAINFEAPVRKREASPVGCWSQNFGASALSSAFHCVVACRMIQAETLFSKSNLLYMDSAARSKTDAGGPHRLGCARDKGKTIYIAKG